MKAKARGTDELNGCHSLRKCGKTCRQKNTKTKKQKLILRVPRPLSSRSHMQDISPNGSDPDSACPTCHIVARHSTTHRVESCPVQERTDDVCKQDGGAVVLPQIEVAVIIPLVFGLRLACAWVVSEGPEEVTASDHSSDPHRRGDSE